MPFKYFFLYSLLINSIIHADIDEKIFIASIPKCGTHLLDKALRLITGKPSVSKFYITIRQENIDSVKPNQILVTHAICTMHNELILSKNDYKGVFIYRDPRDAVVSFANWIYKTPQHWPHHCKLSMNELIFVLTLNFYSAFGVFEIPNLRSIDDFYRKAYLPWKNKPGIYTTTFEKLIGPNGGGNLNDQITELKNIAKHFNVIIDDAQAIDISNKLFGNTFTFSAGQIGTWQKYFNQEHKNVFKLVAGQLLIDLGYEKDLNW